VVLASYDAFVATLPKLAEDLGSDVNSLIYPDYERLVIGWVKAAIGA
jgi:hypothetical protein